VPPSEFQLWHLYDAGGPTLTLKVRFCNEAELPNWQAGPDITEAQAAAEAGGWELYDREPGVAAGEYAILHLVRRQS
jgi:hypothetical protein